MAGPLTKFEFQSGVVKDDSPLQAEGCWIAADKIRFRRGKAETIGGSLALTGGTYTGIPRGAHAWADLTGTTNLAWGTAAKLYWFTGGVTTDITPNHSEGTLYTEIADTTPLTAFGTTTTNIPNTVTTNTTYKYNGGANPSATLSSASYTVGLYFFVKNPTSTTVTVNQGSVTINGAALAYSVPAFSTHKFTCTTTTNFTAAAVSTYDAFTTTASSATVTVYHPNHNLAVGDSITFSHATAVGGITVNGAYTLASVIDADHYTITHGSAATSAASGGGAVDYIAALTAGAVDGTSSVRPRVWSLGNFGEKLVAVPRGQGLYEFQPSSNYAELVFGGTFAASTGWATGTGWSIASGVATKTAGTASNLSQNVLGLVTGGQTYALTFDVTVTAGSLQFAWNAGTPIAAAVNVGQPITQTGSYRRLVRAASDVTDILFTGDNAFAGTVDNVSIKLYNKAYRINEAPTKNEAMLVDPNGFVVLLGSVEADGDYNPMLARWCDQGNNRAWVPDGSNLAGETPLQAGGRMVGGVSARQQNIIVSDEAAYGMQFTGSSGDVFKFNLLGRGCGLIGMKAIAEHDGIAFWMSNNGNFYRCDGSAPVPLDSTLRRDVATNLSANQNEKIHAGINTAFLEVWWTYADSRVGTECNSYVIHNWAENHWSCGTWDRTSWVPQGIFDTPIGFKSGAAYKHETGYAWDGSSISASLTSSWFNIKDGDKLMAVTRLVPDFDDQQGNVSCQMSFKRYPNATAVAGSVYTFAPTTESVAIRRQGRQAQLSFSSLTNPSFWRIGAFSMEIQETGAKR